jgi:hypothetical protein
MLMIRKDKNVTRHTVLKKIQDKLAHTNKQFGGDESAQLLKKILKATVVVCSQASIQ